MGEQIRYKEIEFDMNQLRGMMHELMTRARELLMEIMEIEDKADLPKIP